MQYEIEYVNPSHTHQCDHVQVCNGLAQAREFGRQAKRYPGSIEILRVTKVTPKGVRTAVVL